MNYGDNYTSGEVAIHQQAVYLTHILRGVGLFFMFASMVYFVLLIDNAEMCYNKANKDKQDEDNRQTGKR